MEYVQISQQFIKPLIQNWEQEEDEDHLLEDSEENINDEEN